MKLPRELREFIELLNSHDVRYVIVGGYAVAYHGYPRATGDIDLFVEVSRENARKLSAVLGEFGFASLGLTDKDFLVPGSIIELGHPPNRIELVTSISGVAFADAWECRIGFHVEGLMMFCRRQADSHGQKCGFRKTQGPGRPGCAVVS